jgi:hypothetical protein
VTLALVDDVPALVAGAVVVLGTLAVTGYAWWCSRQ